MQQEKNEGGWMLFLIRYLKQLLLISFLMHNLGLTNSFGDIFIARPKTGVLKIQTKKVLYELIK